MNTNSGGVAPESSPQQQSKTVPEADMMAVKRRAEKAEKEAARLQKELSDRLAHDEEERLKVPADAPETTKALQRVLLEERKKLRQREEEFDRREAETTHNSLAERKRSIAKEHGAPESVVEDAETEQEAELAALRYRVQQQSPGKPGKPAPYDEGSRGGAPSAPKMTPQQLIAEGLRRGEIKTTK